MHSKLFLSSALVALSNAQFQNIDANAANRAGNDVANYISSVATNLEFSSDLNAVASAIPASVYSQAAANPNALASQFDSATALPAWASAIPTSVANSLQSILAKPIKAGDDLDAIVTGSQASSVFKNPAIPTSVQAALQTGDPVDVIGAVLTASTVPSWVSSLPASVQTQIGSIVNAELSTIAADFESSVKPTGAPKATGASSGFPKPSGSGGLGTKSTGAPIAFTGAAAPMRTAAVGAAALFAGAGAWFNV